jgi:hypothetical protein
MRLLLVIILLLLVGLIYRLNSMCQPYETPVEQPVVDCYRIETILPTY